MADLGLEQMVEELLTETKKQDTEDFDQKAGHRGGFRNPLFGPGPPQIGILNYLLEKLKPSKKVS